MIMNKKTRALTEEQYRKIITTINEGFVTAAGERVKPNSRIATALTLEANLNIYMMISKKYMNDFRI